MASCTCHVLCVTKQRRLERFVRPHATPASEGPQELLLWMPPKATRLVCAGPGTVLELAEVAYAASDCLARSGCPKPPCTDLTRRIARD
jgi:hypothetical protein